MTKRLADSKFYPKKDAKERKRLAWAICQKIYKEKNAELVQLVRRIYEE